MKIENINGLRDIVGQELISSEWIQVTQDMINEFASATKDEQWIHTNPDMAKQFSPFGTTVAHGFYSLSLASKIVMDCMEVESAVMGLNYGLNKVRFPNAVQVDSKLRGRVTLLSVEDYPNNGCKLTTSVVIEIEGQEKPACVAEFISLLFEK